MTTTTKVQLDSILFWKMYNALRDAESVLWETDGMITKEDLDQEIIETYKTITNVLDRLEPVVSSLKDIDKNAN